MSDRLVQGNEVLAAVEASAMRAKEIGAAPALAELGFDADQLLLAARRDAADWVRQLPANATIGNVADLLAAASMTSLTAGIRLGRMYGDTERPDS